MARTLLVVLEDAGVSTLRGLLLERVLVLVVEARVTQGLKDPTAPIRFADLEDMLNDARVLEEMADDGIHVDQMSIDGILDVDVAEQLRP